MVTCKPQSYNGKDIGDLINSVVESIKFPAVLQEAPGSNQQSNEEKGVTNGKEQT